MTFMTPEYSNVAFTEILDQSGDTAFVPTNYVDVDETDTIVGEHTGKWFAHLTAAGYMDQTEWSGPFETLDAAREWLSKFYDVDADSGDDLATLVG